jgi:hypothetical protein
MELSTHYLIIIKEYLLNGGRKVQILPTCNKHREATFLGEVLYSSVFGHDQSDPQSMVHNKVDSFLQAICCPPEIGLQGNGLRPEVLPT